MQLIKSTLAVVLFLFPLLMEAACDLYTLSRVDSNQNAITENTELMSDTLVLKIGLREFTATLFNNPTATAFKALLPLTINMTELNGNEKYFDLSKSLPANASNPGKINTGDLLLYGSKTLVLFYKTFSTSYNYTKLGKVDKPGGLDSALGSDNALVTIQLR